jgi:hypothetical protein
MPAEDYPWHFLGRHHVSFGSCICLPRHVALRHFKRSTDLCLWWCARFEFAYTRPNEEKRIMVSSLGARVSPWN